jgi:hypothetical protein
MRIKTDCYQNHVIIGSIFLFLLWHANTYNLDHMAPKQERCYKIKASHQGSKPLHLLELKDT